MHRADLLIDVVDPSLSLPPLWTKLDVYFLILLSNLSHCHSAPSAVRAREPSEANSPTQRVGGELIYSRCDRGQTGIRALDGDPDRQNAWTSHV